MSFILDALRKSEHERQRSAVPGLSQVPLAAPEPQMPRWALAVIAVLGAAVVALGGAWWQSTRAPAEPAASAASIERSIDLPPASPSRPSSTAPEQAAPARAAVPEPPPAEPSPAQTQTTLASAAASSLAPEAFAEPEIDAAAPQLDLPDDAPALPSAAALAAEGVALPPLRLELHAFSGQPRDRFVFINGRKYVEGERLAEGPQLVSIEQRGAVLAHAGRRFLLVQE